MRKWDSSAQCDHGRSHTRPACRHIDHTLTCAHTATQHMRRALCNMTHTTIALLAPWVQTWLEAVSSEDEDRRQEATAVVNLRCVVEAGVNHEDPVEDGTLVGPLVELRFVQLQSRAVPLQDRLECQEAGPDNTPRCTAAPFEVASYRKQLQPSNGRTARSTSSLRLCQT
jgi:hypothetical protein